MRSVDVVIVGAGPAGIGMAMALQQVRGLECEVLERGQLGESFRLWPTQTRFITPSFYSSPFGLADLNAVDPISSPALSAGTEHLSGLQYADYLRSVVETAQLAVSCDCEVHEVASTADHRFRLTTEQGDYDTKFLIWACGEYQFPDLKPFPGAQWCLHYASVTDWRDMEPGHFTVIGGYESGVDAAFNLLQHNHGVRLLVRRKTWDLPDVDDPSQVLSPYSRERLRVMEDAGALEVVYGVDVVEVSCDNQGGVRVHAGDGRYWDSQTPPILGTGFVKGGGARQIAEHWSWDEAGRIRLSENDESLRTPGLFLVGPQVRHDAMIYCFIYKFRQRFDGIAREIARRLELDCTAQILTSGTWGPFGNPECCEGCAC
ncbi:NAD(P)-binding domain-containing protein [Pseudomonas sp. S60]|uniref:NAD(P)/FAD-dependent oxidoreductase n=1 Tax=Pseudomonas sp. S60 TaxID=211124 RepID=UPI001911F6AF|nr:NAD(P)/FAD-dependent oxidoreductase [Pseudomonas sp. S60]MBK5011943.1 NAD(P)-binding domain-containing protein [Pseudomonas sp. S60]